MNSDIMSIPKVKPRELNQGGTSTTETTFSSDGTVPVVLPLPAAGQLCGGSMAQKPSISFKVIAVGRVNTAGNYNVTVKMYYGTALATASNTAIATTGVVAVNTTNCPWRLTADLIWDSDSNKIDGTYTGVLNGTRVAATIITNGITGANPTTGVAQGFTITGTFGTGSATNTMNLDWFVLIPME